MEQQRTNAAICTVARHEQYVHELGGDNRGWRVEQYQRRAGGEPGEPWCVDFVYWVVSESCTQLALSNPLPKIRNAVRLAEWLLTNRPEILYTFPAPGRIYLLKHTASTGHAGICLTTNQTGDNDLEISGNTNDKGSRQGNMVQIHQGLPEVTHGGELQFWVDIQKFHQLQQR